MLRGVCVMCCGCCVDIGDMKVEAGLTELRLVREA